MKKATLFCLLLCALMLIAPFTAFAETPPPTGQGLIITEICFNPQWKEGDENIESSTDMFPYTEIYNSSDKEISLASLSLTYRSDSVGVLESGALLCAGEAPVLGAGEVAVIVHYNKNWAKLGLDNTADLAANVYETFADLHGVTDILDKNHFFVVPNKDFKLDKTSENASMELFCDGTLVWSVTYNAVYYNRNNRAMVFHADGTSMGAALPKPGGIYDNQIPNNPALVPNTSTIAVKAVQYNICASGVPNYDENIPFIAERYQEAFALIEAEDPDLIVLCEVNYAWQAYIQEFCKKNGYTAYGHSSSGRDFNGTLKQEQWDLISLILWKTDRFDVVEQGRFWCSATPDKKGSYKWANRVEGDFARCINHTILKDKTSGVEFLFVGAHIDAKVDEARTLSAQLIYDKAHEIAGERPIIMMGDWNSNQTRDSYHILTSGDLADARYRTVNTDLHGTFNKWGEYSADIQTRLPIDHCFITKDTIWVDYYKQVTGEPIANVAAPSDHNMTVFSLLLANDNPISETTEAQTEEPATTEEITEAIDASSSTEPAPEQSQQTEPNESKGGCRSISLCSILLLCLTGVACLQTKKKH